jgi:hypothetical protein
VHERVLDLARADARVVAGAMVGGLALGGGDRWSDLDLTFAVADGVPVTEVLEDWTRQIEELDAVHLFDLWRGPSVYRVFLFPGCLQVDLSFTPAPEFGAGGPKFRLLFGEAVEREHFPQPSAHELFGYAVHHAVRGRFSIERGRLWQAEYWISAVRDYAMSLACLSRGLPAIYGRGFDDLPAEVLEPFREAIVRSLEPVELLRALGHGIDGLLRESGQVPELAARLEPQLRALTAANLS